jgi:hypothetical protein
MVDSDSLPLGSSAEGMQVPMPPLKRAESTKHPI